MKLIDFLSLHTSLPKIGKKVCVFYSKIEKPMENVTKILITHKLV